MSQQSVKHFLRSCCLVFMAYFLSIPAMAETNDSSERTTIRVAFPTQEGMSYIGHSGKVTGYSYGTVYTTLCALSSSSLREHNLITQDVLRVGL